MKKPISILLFIIFVVSACDFVNNAKSKLLNSTSQKPLAKSTLVEASADTIQVSTPPRKKAFGNLYFGMPENEVKEKNEQRQKLGKYTYNFSYRFNGDNQLYAVTLLSNPVNTLHYDMELKNNYNNLSRILNEKFGKASFNTGYPSLFDVQNTRALVAQKWNDNDRQIQLGIRENKRDSYSVFCKIVDSEMDKQERERLYKLKNKDIIDAAEKF